MEKIIYYSIPQKVLINSGYYSFYISYDEFLKYNINDYEINNIDNIPLPLKMYKNKQINQTNINLIYPSKYLPDENKKTCLSIFNIEIQNWFNINRNNLLLTKELLYNLYKKIQLKNILNTFYNYL